MDLEKAKILMESENIYYVQVTKELVQDYLTMVNDINIRKLLSPKIRTFTVEEELEWIKSNLENKAVQFSMLEKKTGKFIGNIGLTDFADNSAEIGITITSEMQNKHYGTEGIKTIINYGFEKLNLDEINLVVFSNNVRAIHCYKRLGFVEYKVEKDVAIIDNQSVDDVYMRLKKRV